MTLMDLMYVHAVVTTVDKKHQSEGITTMRVGYTGTQQEAKNASRAALDNEMQVRHSNLSLDCRWASFP